MIVRFRNGKTVVAFSTEKLLFFSCDNQSVGKENAPRFDVEAMMVNGALFTLACFDNQADAEKLYNHLVLAWLDDTEEFNVTLMHLHLDELEPVDLDNRRETDTYEPAGTLSEGGATESL